MVENSKYEIDEIVIEMDAKCYCPLGKDWYTNHFTVFFTPNEVIPDYCELDKFVKNEINGQYYIIEEAVQRLHDYIKVKYNPVGCVVKSYVDDAAHSTVTVTKAY